MTISEPLYISAAHKSSGKTTLTIGISAALSSLNKKVQVFKKGPDYIDPLWHTQATSRSCYNLDYNTMSKGEILSLYLKKAQGSDINLIEGNKGLYDGLNLDGSNSNAALAKLLDANIILVLDAQGMTRGIAPLVLGYQAFDPEIKIKGVILNKLGGSRHESKLRAVLEHYTDVPVIGAVHRHKALSIAEKHLGLIPSNEDNQAQQKIKAIADIIKQSVDLDRLIEFGQHKLSASVQDTGSFAVANNAVANKEVTSTKINIAIFKDKAFGFYYQADMEALEDAGATLIYCNALEDELLPDDIDGLFIGGGFPERYMQALSQNSAFKTDLKQKIESGMPCYAECGGLMYLSRSITWNNKKEEMVGIIEADVKMSEKPQGRGLIQFSENKNMLWPALDKEEIDLKPVKNHIIAAHEFHYSKLVNIAKNVKFAYDISRGTGIDGKHDAIVYKNLLASYAHLQDSKQNHWAKRFVQFIKQLNLENVT
jgi:cobyrinic acid a,c-diamide synthase